MNDGVDLTSTLINLGIFVATVIAAIVAWRGVRDAQIARDASSDHEAAALQHAEAAAASAGESAAAQQRTAEALEEANRREAARDEARVPWQVARVSSDRWRVTNNTGGQADFVTVEVIPPATATMEDGFSMRDVPPGQPFFVHFGGGMTDPATATLRIVWRDGLRVAHEAVVVLG